MEMTVNGSWRFCFKLPVWFYCIFIGKLLQNLFLERPESRVASFFPCFPFSYLGILGRQRFPSDAVQPLPYGLFLCPSALQAQNSPAGPAATATFAPRLLQSELRRPCCSRDPAFSREPTEPAWSHLWTRAHSYGSCRSLCTLGSIKGTRCVFRKGVLAAEWQVAQNEQVLKSGWVLTVSRWDVEGLSKVVALAVERRTWTCGMPFSSHVL